MTNYKVPPTFVLDHIERNLLPQENIVEIKKKYVVVSLNDDQFSELLSDAKHYADGAGGLDPEYRGLIMSARATVKALRKYL